jgi:hypothetical protein
MTDRLFTLEPLPTPALLVTTSHPSLHEHPGSAGEPVHPRLGRLIQPRHTSSIELTAAAGIPWAADNDCFQQLDPFAFDEMLERIRPLAGATLEPDGTVRDRKRDGTSTCKFVTVPDHVGDAYATAISFERWAPALERRGLPVALVIQDGITDLDAWLERTWHRLDAVFIGGSTDFKLSATAAAVARAARDRGKWVHWGRVNTRRRIAHIIATGAADSFDGTKYAKFRTTYLSAELEHLETIA